MYELHIKIIYSKEPNFPEFRQLPFVVHLKMLRVEEIKWEFYHPSHGKLTSIL